MANSSILTVTLEHGASLPPDNQATGDYYVQIGSWNVTGSPARLIPHNDRYGPIDASVCPDPFTNPVTQHLSVGAS